MASSSATVTTPLRKALPRRPQVAPNRLVSTVRRLLSDQAPVLGRVDQAAAKSRGSRGRQAAGEARPEGIPVIAIAAAMAAVRRQAPAGDRMSAARDVSGA